jgi:hypothetical protein
MPAKRNALQPWLEVRRGLSVGPLFRHHPRRQARSALDQARGAHRPAAHRRRAGSAASRSPHQLRHAHAIETPREGVPLIVIQRQSRHHVRVSRAHRQRRDHRDRPRRRAPDDSAQRVATALISAAARSNPACRALRKCGHERLCRDGGLPPRRGASESCRASVRPGSQETTASTESSGVPVDRPHPCAPLDCIESRHSLSDRSECSSQARLQKRDALHARRLVLVPITDEIRHEAGCCPPENPTRCRGPCSSALPADRADRGDRAQVLDQHPVDGESALA